MISRARAGAYVQGVREASGKSTIPNEEVRIVAIDVADESDDEFRQAQEIGINE